MREIKFRGKRIDNGEWIYGSLINNVSVFRTSGEPVCHIIDYSKFPPTADSWEDIFEVIEEYEVDGETVGEFVCMDGKEENEWYEGDVLSVWFCYKTSQTHTGDNIPNGSYTEPDEPQLIKLNGEIVWDDTQCAFVWSLVGKAPYNFQQAFNFPVDKLPIIGREYYSHDYIRWAMDYPDKGFCKEEQENEYQKLIAELTGMTEDEFCKIANDVVKVGNIYENPELL